MANYFVKSRVTTCLRPVHLSYFCLSTRYEQLSVVNHSPVLYKICTVRIFKVLSVLNPFFR